MAMLPLRNKAPYPATLVAAPKVAPLSTSSVAPYTISGRELFKLFTPSRSLTNTVPLPDSVTSSSLVGTALVDQLFGLFQLKPQAASDVARWLGERPPNEAALLDPARSVRFGARYLRHLLERFGGDTLLAVAAYNAGPGAIEHWQRIRTWRDRALDVELIARPETEDYVKRVLAVRQAYRELAPAPLR